MITSNIIKILPRSLRKKVENNHELRKILGNINWLTAGVIFKDVIGLFVVAWVARYLGPEQFGAMNYAIAFVALFSTLSTLGLDNIVIRNILLKSENKEKYLGTAFVLKLVGSFMMLVLSSVVIYFLQPDNTLLRLFVFIIAFGYIFKAFDVIDFWFQSKIEAKYSVYARSISFLIVSILKVAFILTQSPLTAFILMFSLDFFLTAVFLVYLYIKRERRDLTTWEVKLETTKELLKDSWPLILSGLAVTIYMKIDQVLIGNILGDRELGIYSSAVKLSHAWYFVPVVITTSVFPAILNSKKKNRNLYLSRIQMLYDFLVWFAISVSIVATLFSKQILVILYGEVFISGAPLLALGVWVGVFVCMGVVNGRYLLVENLQKITFVSAISASIVNIIFNILLIPEFGTIGAVFASLISYFVGGFLVLLFFEKARILVKMQLEVFNLGRIIKYFR